MIRRVPDLIDGTLDGWPVSLMIERDAGGVAYAGQLAPISDAPDAVSTKCEAITEACDLVKPAAVLRRAMAMGFVPDDERLR